MCKYKWRDDREEENKAINREGGWKIDMNSWYIGVYTQLPVDHFKKCEMNKEFKYKDYNNSEQEALNAALNYIFKGE